MKKIIWTLTGALLISITPQLLHAQTGGTKQTDR
jgi:hypothetical protein